MDVSLNDVKYLCRNYIGTQKLRMAEQARLREFIERCEEEGREPPDEVIRRMKTHITVLRREEKQIIKDFKEMIPESFVAKTLTDYCKRVKGLDFVSAMEFLGYVNLNVHSMGKVRAMAGLAPGRRFYHGKKLNYNPLVKGKFWYMAQNVIMKKDEYYYPLYQSKKKWLLAREFEKYIKNPRSCPRYDICKQKIEAKAARIGKPSKEPACRAHVDQMAKIWLASLIVGHMFEICKTELREPVPKHRMHIPPKPADEAHLKAVLTVACPVIERGQQILIDLGDRKEALKAAEIVGEGGTETLFKHYTVYKW